MRPKGSSLECKANTLTSHLDIVVEQLESRLVIHAHPYDSDAPKVRESAHALEHHAEFPVLERQLGNRRADGGEPLG